MLAKRLAAGKLQERLKLPDISPRNKFAEVVKEAVRRKTMAEIKEEKREAVMFGYISAMQAHSEIGAVQEEAMLALCHIIAKGEGIRTLVRTGGVDSIVLAMCLHLGKEDIQQRGATALAQVAATSPECRQAVVDAAGHTALVDATRAHARNPAVLERTCNALAAIAAGGDDACKRACVEAGAAAAVTETMLAYPRRAIMQIRGGAVLAALAAGDTPCRLSIVHAGGVAAICGGMEGHGAVPEVQHIGCALLHQLARGEALSARAVLEASGVRRLCSAMRWYPVHLPLVLDATAALAHLSTCAASEDMGGGASAGAMLTHGSLVPVLISVVDKHKKRAAVAAHALAVLGNLMSVAGYDGVDLVLRHSGLQLVVEVMLAHPRHGPLLSQACTCFLNAAAVSMEAKEEIACSVHVQGPMAMVRAAADNPTNAHLAAAACAALANVAAGDEETERDEEVLLGSAASVFGECEEEDGGLPLEGAPAALAPKSRKASIIGVLPSSGANGGGGGGGGGGVFRPETSQSISRSGTWRTPAAPAGVAPRIQTVREAIVEAAVPAALRKWLTEHRESPAVAEEALAVYRNLSAGASHACCEAIVAADGVRAVVGAMRHHYSERAIQIEGCLAVRNMACGDAQHLAALLEANAVLAVVGALRNHPAEPELARAGCAALRNMAVDSWGTLLASGLTSRASAGAIKYITDADGARAVVDVMTKNAADALIQAHGCGALRNLACGTLGDAPSRATALNAIAAAGGPRAVLEALAGHPSDVRVATQACGCVRNLAISPGARAELVAAGAVAPVVAVFAAHPHAREPLEQASAALSYLLRAPPLKKRQPEGQEAGSSASSSPAGARPRVTAGKAALDAGAVPALLGRLTAPPDGLDPGDARLVANCATALAALVDPATNATLAPAAVTAVLAALPATEGLGSFCPLFAAYANETATLLPAAKCLCCLVEAADMPSKRGLAESDLRMRVKHGLYALHESGLFRLTEPGCEALIEIIEYGVR